MSELGKDIIKLAQRLDKTIDQIVEDTKQLKALLKKLKKDE